ncbi:hypothetical protein Tco_1516608 [Tanacetum coccineum]
MHTRSQSRNLHNQQHQAPPPVVEQFNLEEPIENPDPLAPMDDTRTMAQLLEAPTAGYEDAIVVPEITADNFELKHGLLNLVQNKQFFGHDKEDPHAHIRYFNKITSTMKFPNVPSITTRSGVAYKGPTIHTTSSPKVVEREPEVTKDTMLPTNNGITEDVQPPVVPVVYHESISEPVNAPVKYSQEVSCFSNVISSGNPTPYYDPIVSTTSPTLTLFGDSDFLLFEEADSFLAIEDDPTSPEVDPTYYDPDGDILLLKAILNINEPPENEEKAALIEVLKSHKRAIAWKLSDIKGIDPEFCTHKILMEEDYEPTVQHQRRVNPKIHDVIKKEVEKLLDAGLIYPISDSPWVSPVHCVPKKGGMTVVKNDENDLIPTRLVIGWRVCIDYRKLNEATRKDHFPLPFMDQMLERLAGNQFYCFLDGFSGYFQIPIDPKDQEKSQ